jgi:Trk K+ transport system NAD-binding subunit
MNKNKAVLLKVLLWGSAIMLVLIIGITYFPLEIDGLSFWGALYYTIRLFILEHDLTHFPTFKPLIFIYFFAPAIALSAVGTFLTYIYKLSPDILSRWKKRHIVICGVGRTGSLLVKTLSERGLKTVGVDTGPHKDFEALSLKYKIPVIHGSFLSKDVLQRARAHKAQDIVFASSDDLLNLEGVIGAYDWLSREKVKPNHPVRLWAHVANERLAETARMSLQTNGNMKIRFFDTFHIAASRMLAKFFDYETRKGVKEITILGFGKFGRDLMEVLIQDAKEDECWTVRVVDVMDREKEVKTLARELNILDKVTFTQADIMDLEFHEDESKAFFLCTDDDIRNLTTALMLTNKIKGHCIYVRMGMWPLAAVKDHLSEMKGIVFVNINDLVEEGIKNLKEMNMTMF